MCINGGGIKRGAAGGVLRSCSTERGRGAKRGGCVPFARRPTFPVCAQRRGGANPARGNRAPQYPWRTGGVNGGAHRWGPRSKRGRGHAKADCMPPPPLCTPIRMPRCTQRGEGTRGRGGGALGRGHHVSHVQPIPARPLRKWRRGGGVPRRPTPVPCRGANERPPFTHERVRGPKGWWRVPRSLSCANHRGRGSKGGGRTFRAPPCIPQRAEAGAMRHQGEVCLHLYPSAHPRACVFSRKGGRSLPVGGSERRVGGDSHASHEYRDALLFTRCFALFLFILTCLFTEIQIDKTFKKRSFNRYTGKPDRTVGRMRKVKDCKCRATHWTLSHSRRNNKIHCLLRQDLRSGTRQQKINSGRDKNLEVARSLSRSCAAITVSRGQFAPDGL